MSIINWKLVKPGQHVTLACGCAGWVSSVSLTGETGFMLQYTRWGCKRGLRSTEKDRKEGRELANFFNAGLEDNSMHVEVSTPPLWWKEYSNG